MNYIDLFVLVLLIWSVYKGITRGLVRQLAGLAAVLFGIYGALKLAGMASRVIYKILQIDPQYLYLISLGVTFLLLFYLVYLLGRLLDKLIEHAELGILNKISGAAFSLAKVALITGVFLLYVNQLDKRFGILPEHSREHSLFYRPVTSFAGWFFPSLKSEESGNSSRLKA